MGTYSACRFPNFVSSSQFLCHPGVINDKEVGFMTLPPTSGSRPTRGHDLSFMDLVVKYDEASEKAHKELETAFEVRRLTTKVARAG